MNKLAVILIAFALFTPQVARAENWVLAGEDGTIVDADSIVMNPKSSVRSFLSASPIESGGKLVDYMGVNCATGEWVVMRSSTYDYDGSFIGQRSFRPGKPGFHGIARLGANGNQVLNFVCSY